MMTNTGDTVSILQETTDKCIHRKKQTNVFTIRVKTETYILWTKRTIHTQCQGSTKKGKL